MGSAFWTNTVWYVLLGVTVAAQVLYTIFVREGLLYARYGLHPHPPLY